KPPKGPRKAAPKKAAARKGTAKKTDARRVPAKRTATRVAARRTTPARVTPVVRQASAAAVLRPVAPRGGGDVGKSAAAAYLEARRRGPGEPVRPAAAPPPRTIATTVRPASGGAP